MEIPKTINRHNGKSVFQTTVFSLLVLLLVEAFLLLGSFFISGVVGKLDQNAQDILNKQVQNRARYLENSMTASWSDLDMLADTINAATQTRLDNGTLSLEELDSSSNACAPLILDIADDLISSLYAKQVTGIFVVFNTQDLSQDSMQKRYQNKTGIYIRDMDPSSSPPARNGDLLLERAPIAVVESLNVATDSGWNPLFSFGETNRSYYDFLYQPFQAAYQAKRASQPSDYGYWSSTPYVLQGSSLSAISYSIPLVLPDGTVYGVLGVELLNDYLRTLLPMGELYEENKGSYLLAVSQDGKDQQGQVRLSPVTISGILQRELSEGDTLTLQKADKGGYAFELDGKQQYADVELLTLYSNNAPFDQERWSLIGVVQTNWLYAFSRQMTTILLAALLVNLAAGIVGSVIISRRLSNPIQVLSKEVAQAEKGDIPRLSATGLREIDQFAGAITALSRDVVAASTRFLRIMEMASVELGGFEYRKEENSIFVTQNFFPLLGRNDVDPEHLTAEEFRRQMVRTFEKLEELPSVDGSRLYRVSVGKDQVRYVRVEVTKEGDRQVGLVEDVTTATMERLRIEHDRDYDLLTGLLNRRAFYRLAGELFDETDRLRHAALVMLDLDNLKVTNDRFGHDWGDQYIRQSGQCFANHLPPSSLCARVSGDEFALLLWGYESQDEIRQVLKQLAQGIRDSVFPLPNGDVSQIRVSGGVAWYPEDSQGLSELMKLADFAMYQVKQTQKGRFEEFDLGVYNHETYLLQCRREIHQLLEEERFSYAFQPIVDARTGAICAYEALMRVNMPALQTPDVVLAMAKEEGQLQKMEKLSWFKAAESYLALLEQKLISPDAYLFINSIAGQSMSLAEMEIFHQKYHRIQDRIVIEITESEAMDPEATQRKREAPGFSGLFALDDYGSGYNSEKNLLELAPAFIKVDISIIQNIDTDLDKQKIVSNVVEYAHERGMAIIAEGLETAAEVQKVLELGVDLLQGYFLARPAAVPRQVNPEAREILQKRNAPDAARPSLLGRS